MSRLLPSVHVAVSRAPSHAGWVAAGAGLVGVLLGGAAVALGVRERPDALATSTALASSVTAAAAGGASAAVEARPLLEASRGDLAAAVALTRDAVVNLGTAGTLGAGVIVDDSGVVLTNYHVIADALRSPGPSLQLEDRPERPTVSARFENGREIPALVLVADAEEDLAILRLSPTDEDERFAAVTLGKSSELEVGQEVFSIGNPFGLSHTVSRGIVSALDRTGILQNPDLPLVQLDAAINLGNSGGPLFSLDGQLMGLVTARRQHANGIAFAVPVDHIRGFLRAVQDPHARRSGTIGIEMRTDTELPSAVGELGYGAGLLLTSVEEDSPASRAGLQKDDTIVEVRGKRLDGLPQSGDPAALALHVAATVRPMFAGEKLALTVVRGDALERVQVVIGPATPQRQAHIDAEELLGLRLDRDATAPVVRGVIKGSPLESLATELAGARIVRWLGEDIETVEQLGEALEQVRSIVRAQQRAVSVLIGFRDANGRPLQELHVLVQ
jgi:S1-C subfamily serine protease